MTEKYGNKSLFDESSEEKWMTELLQKAEMEDFDIKDQNENLTNDQFKELILKAKECSSDIRNQSDIVLDNVLLMYLISKTKNDDLGITKLQKLIFLVESILSSENVRTFSYNFYKWNYGPFNKEIYKDEGALVENDFIMDSPNIQLTERGKTLLKYCDELFEENKSVLKKIDHVIENYDPYSLKQIKEIVYEIKIMINGKSQTIDEIPKGNDLHINISKKDASDTFKIKREWENTLDILLDSEFSDSLIEALDSSKEDNSYSHDEVFSNV